MRRLLLLFVLALFPVAAWAASAHPGVLLHVSVAGSRVLADGKEALASAPQEALVPLNPGEHTLRVEHEGFAPWEQKVQVAAGEPQRVEVLLKVNAPQALALAKGPKAIRVGVYEVKAAAGVDPRVVTVTSGALLAEVRKLERISAISMEEIGEMLSFEQKRQLLGCDQDACLAEIAGAMGVDELVTAEVSTLGESRLFTIRRIDMLHAAVKGSSTKRLAIGNGEELLTAIGPAIQELFPEYPLREGRTRGVSSAVAARLNPPPLPKPVFFTAAGLAVAAGVVGTFYGVSYRDAQSQHDDLAKQSLTEVVPAKDLKHYGDLATSNARTANIAFGVAGGLAVTAGVIALFTDWHGYRNATEASPATKVAVQLAPTGVLVTWR